MMMINLPTHTHTPNICNHIQDFYRYSLLFVVVDPNLIVDIVCVYGNHDGRWIEKRSGFFLLIFYFFSQENFFFSASLFLYDICCCPKKKFSSNSEWTLIVSTRKFKISSFYLDMIMYTHTHTQTDITTFNRFLMHIYDQNDWPFDDRLFIFLHFDYDFCYFILFGFFDLLSKSWTSSHQMSIIINNNHIIGEKKKIMTIGEINSKSIYSWFLYYIWTTSLFLLLSSFLFSLYSWRVIILYIFYFQQYSMFV